jgi:hypothetical protein
MSAQQQFPNLASSNYRITSPQTPEYNCIAWAAEDTERWWWPDQNLTAYWPKSIARLSTLEAFTEAFRSLGYEICDNDQHETGVEKVAIYAGSLNEPTHAARQLPTGRWTSKMGQWVDLEHDLEDLSGPEYGSPAVFLKRPIS